MSIRNSFALFKRRFRKIFSRESFALSPVWVQLIAIFITSAIIVVILAPLLGGLPTSYRLFADPANYAYAQGPVQLVVGLIQVLVGLVLFSFIISVLSAALIKLIENIKSGTLPYQKRGHIVFVNYNIKLPLILDQFNLRAKEKSQIQDVVLLFSSPAMVVDFRTQMDMKRWSNLEIYLRQGELMSFQTYERLSILKAQAIVILFPDSIENHFKADNFNLKLLTTLISNPGFYRHLAERQRSRYPIKCSIELSNDKDSRKIAHEMSSNEGGAMFSIITPGDVIGNIMARAKVDVVYYKVFFEILSLDGPTIQFVNPKRFSPSGKLTGVNFEHLSLGFSGGSLLGYSSVNDNGGFEMNLCPFGQALGPSDWLLFITADVKALKYKDSPNPEALSKHEAIIPPNEFANKRICVIGSAWPLGNIDDFIDVSSLAAMNEAHFVFDSPQDYLAPAFQDRLLNGNFDNIIINLDDELGFRLTMLLVTSNRNSIDFLTKIVTILGDPMTEKILNKNILTSNTVLSHKLSARYIAQLSFQKNLDRLFSELAAAGGADFNLLEIGKHIPATLIQHVDGLKKLLAAYQMVYIGTVDSEKNINLTTSKFSHTKQIIVLNKRGRNPMDGHNTPVIEENR